MSDEIKIKDWKRYLTITSAKLNDIDGTFYNGYKHPFSGELIITVFSNQITISIDNSDNNELEFPLSIGQVDKLILMLQSARKWQLENAP